MVSSFWKPRKPKREACPRFAPDVNRIIAPLGRRPVGIAYASLRAVRAPLKIP